MSKYAEFHTDVSQGGTMFQLTFYTNVREQFLEMQELARKFVDQTKHKQISFIDRGDAVEDNIIEGRCDGCDQDPAKCYNQGYCEYEKEE